MVDGLRRLDHAGIAAWLVETLTTWAHHPVEAIVPVGHGAGVVALTSGALAGHAPAFPPLDYEQPLPTDLLAGYRAQRDPFALTGSPALPDGLNFGAQLFWLDRLYPTAMAGSVLLPWAQYWAWFLTGIAVSEVSSLGCHSDLWSPAESRFSPVAERQGWAAKFAPLARADSTIGTLRPELAATTGLSPQVRVLAGLHDSNAALHAARGFPALAGREATVLSTGTWFVAMRLPAAAAAPPPLDEARDCLINVDIHARPVPSARFMGGREIELVIEHADQQVDSPADQPALLAAAAQVLATGALLLPTLAPGCGPFAQNSARFVAPPVDANQRRALACLYAALVADQALDLIGARECLLVEGRFAHAEVFVRALAALRPATEVLVADQGADAAFGALRLLHPNLRPAGTPRRVAPLAGDLAAYRQSWLAELTATTGNPPA